MKKLESLKEFNNSKLHRKYLSMINGGVKVGDSTVGGVFETIGTNTGCMAYTSDTVTSINEDGSIGGRRLHGYSEVAKNNCDCLL